MGQLDNRYIDIPYRGVNCRMPTTAIGFRDAGGYHTGSSMAARSIGKEVMMLSSDRGDVIKSPKCIRADQCTCMR